mgnify:CR=1 FL=1
MYALENSFLITKNDEPEFVWVGDSWMAASSRTDTSKDAEVLFRSLYKKKEVDPYFAVKTLLHMCVPGPSVAPMVSLISGLNRVETLLAAMCLRPKSTSLLELLSNLSRVMYGCDLEPVLGFDLRMLCVHWDGQPGSVMSRYKRMKNDVASFLGAFLDHVYSSTVLRFYAETEEKLRSLYVSVVCDVLSKLDEKGTAVASSVPTMCHIITNTLSGCREQLLKLSPSNTIQFVQSTSRLVLPLIESELSK